MPVLAPHQVQFILNRHGLKATALKTELIQLLSVYPASLTQKDIRDLLPYKRLSIYRALKQLEAAKLVRRDKRGAKKYNLIQTK